LIRKRLYSWSRPSLHRPRKSQDRSEVTIKGKSTLAFTPDGKWFQGNIISDTEDAYTISGRKCSRLDSISEPLEPPGTDHLAPNSDSPATIASSPLSSSFSNNSETCSVSPSEIDSLDSELVRAAIERFDLEDDDSEVLYDISILDYETGMNHGVKGVTGNISGDSCSLVGESFSFRSESVHKGAMAEMVIQKNLGQALQHRNMIVYQGELEFTYHDQACFPVYQEDNSGQWCL